MSHVSHGLPEGTEGPAHQQPGPGGSPACWRWPAAPVCMMHVRSLSPCCPTPPQQLCAAKGCVWRHRDGGSMPIKTGGWCGLGCFFLFLHSCWGITLCNQHAHVCAARQSSFLEGKHCHPPGIHVLWLHHWPAPRTQSPRSCPFRSTVMRVGRKVKSLLTTMMVAHADAIKMRP